MYHRKILTCWILWVGSLATIIRVIGCRWVLSDYCTIGPLCFHSCYHLLFHVACRVNCIPLLKYLTKTGSSLPGIHSCKSTSVMNTDLKTVNKTVKRFIEDTGRTNEPMAKYGKYKTPTLHNSMHRFASTLRKQGCNAFCNYLCVGLIPSHSCTTVQVFTSYNKFGNLKFGDLTLECQIAKFNSLPIFLAI